MTEGEPVVEITHRDAGAVSGSGEHRKSRRLGPALQYAEAEMRGDEAERTVWRLHIRNDRAAWLARDEGQILDANIAQREPADNAMTVMPVWCGNGAGFGGVLAERAAEKGDRRCLPARPRESTS